MLRTLTDAKRAFSGDAKEEVQAASPGQGFVEGRAGFRTLRLVSSQEVRRWNHIVYLRAGQELPGKNSFHL